MRRQRNAFPGIPDPQPTLESLFEVARNLKEAVEILRGIRGGGEERALTQRDIEAGLDISWEQISVGLPSTFPPAPHGHTISDVSGLSTALAGKAALNHTHPFSQITGTASLGQLPVDAIRTTIQPQLQLDASQISNLPFSPGGGTIGSAGDVDLTDLQDGYVLAWDDYLELWTPVEMAGGVESLSDLSDVDDDLAPEEGQLLGYASGEWTAVNPPEGGGGSSDPIRTRSGTATIEHPDTEIEVEHEADFFPIQGRVHVTPHDDEDGWLDGAASTKYAVRDFDDTSFVIALDTAPGVGKHVTLDWLLIESVPQASQTSGLNMTSDPQLNML